MTEQNNTARTEVKVYRYSLPNGHDGQGWGIFLIDSWGTFAAVTDFGNYAYKWPRGSEHFREFLAGGLSPDYLCGKIASRDVLRADDTKQYVRETILGRRRCGSITKDRARAEWDLLGLLDFTDPSDYAHWHRETHLEDAWDMGLYGYPTDATMFAALLFPRLVEAIRAELAAEKGAAA